MALYDGVAGVARKVKKKYDGVAGVARKVTKAYDGVDNVARQYFSSDAVWSKYSCDAYSEYYERYEGINEPQTMYNHTYGCGYPMNLITGYRYSSSIGYIGTASSVTIPENPTLEDIAEAFVGKYYVDSWSNPQYVLRYDSITSFVAPDEDGRGYFQAEGTLIERCQLFPAEYYKGSKSYGTLAVEDGQLPEEGTLIEGSFEEGYCVLKIDGTYYYYVLED